MFTKKLLFCLPNPLDKFIDRFSTNVEHNNNIDCFMEEIFLPTFIYDGNA